jgi:hypothetical protein
MVLLVEVVGLHVVPVVRRERPKARDVGEHGGPKGRHVAEVEVVRDAVRGGELFEEATSEVRVDDVVEPRARSGERRGEVREARQVLPREEGLELLRGRAPRP